MTSLFVFASIEFAPMIILHFLSLILGIVLIGIWWLKVKTIDGLFKDKAKIKSTLLFFVPGYLFAVVGFYFNLMEEKSVMNTFLKADEIEVATDTLPDFARIYIANYTEEMGYVRVGGQVEAIYPKTAEEIKIKSELEKDRLMLVLGDSLIYDSLIVKGTYIGNFSDDIYVTAEKNIYTDNRVLNFEKPEFLLNIGPGIKSFSADLDPRVDGFEKRSPESVSMHIGQLMAIRWDVEAVSREEFLVSYREFWKNSH